MAISTRRLSSEESVKSVAPCAVQPDPRRDRTPSLHKLVRHDLRPRAGHGDVGLLAAFGVGEAGSR